MTWTIWPLRTRFGLSMFVSAACFANSPEMVDIGDHKLAIARSGQGIPTVVMESGAGGDIPAWTKIMSGVGSFTSAVTYARAGRGASEAAKTPRTLTNMVTELHEMLVAAGYKPPYVLVGRSLGGIFVRAFAIMYPGETAGLVLVDGSHERQQIEFAKAEGLTTEMYFAKTKQANIQDAATSRELDGLKPVLISGNLGLSGLLSDLPMVVITSTRPDRPPAVLKAWRVLQDEVFRSTTHGMHIVTNKSGHNITETEPELVINSIRWVVDTVRADQPDK